MEKDKFERRFMCLCMDTIMRSLNDETYCMEWLQDGIADGDIDFDEIKRAISPALSDDSNTDLSYYDDDANFADLMDTFLYLIAWACNKATTEKQRRGVLYSDGVISDVYHE